MGSTSRPTSGSTPTGSPSSLRSTTTSAARTKLYGAALYRLRPEDFGEFNHVEARTGVAD